MLVGRTQETTRLERLLEAARGGHGATIVLRGEAGIGKTRLAEEAVARSAGFTVLRARGWELEANLPFSAMTDVVAPLRPLVDDLPPAQARALESALGVGPPAPGDRFAVYLALVGLLARAAAAAPLLVLIDDAQWLDLASCEALAFASRRLADAPVVFLACVRRERRPDPVLPHGVELALSGIDEEPAAALLAARAPVPVAPEVVHRLHEVTRGNPLALAELAVALAAPQLAGRHPIPDPLPLSRGVAEGFARRAAAMPDGARRMLLLTAAAGPQAAHALAGAAAATGLCVADLEHAEREGMLELGERGPAFCQPLMRSAVYYAADPHERRAAHDALAAALALHGPQELHAWHLAAAAIAPDEGAAAALDAAAANATGRSAYAVAAVTRERAAALSPRPADRGRRLLAAASAWALAGRLDRAAGLADGAAVDAEDPALRLDARLLAGRLALMRGSARLAAEILLAEADAPDQAPQRGAALLAEATVALIMQGDHRPALATARRAAAAGDQVGGAARLSTRAALGLALVLTGRGREGCGLLLEYADALDAGLGVTDGDPLAVLALRGLVWAGETERAEPLLKRRIAALRGAGALGHLAMPLAAQVEVELRAGRWGVLAERAGEVLAMARETRQGRLVHTVVRDQATVAAAQGREDDCRALVEEMERLTEASDVASRLGSLSVLGFLELSLGRSDRAVAHLEEAAWTARGVYGLREPNVLRWAPDLIEACLHAGRPETAHRELALLAREARASAAGWTRAAVARCHGMLATASEADRHFLEALALHGPAAEPFERARTELAMGERRRRLRRRAQAREPLESALATFNRLGARPWAERARAELAAAGAPPAEPRHAGTLRAVPVSGPLVAMTPQERRLAMLVASGATNREVAASVHLSTKTVEEHLSRLYRKLGVRSRTELASVVLAGEAASR